MYQKLLVATDGSELGDRAVSAGIELAKSLGAKVVFARVIPRYPVSYFDGGIALDLAVVAKIESDWHSKAEQALVNACEAAAEQGVKASKAVIKSNLIAESLIAATKKHRCDLVVMASHGYKGIKRVLLGSETLNVLAQSAIPVLVLR